MQKLLTKNEAEAYRYNKWAGNPKGTAHKTGFCAEEVPDKVTWGTYQCSRKNGYGPDGLYCKQHAKRYQ